MRGGSRDHRKSPRLVHAPLPPLVFSVLTVGAPDSVALDGARKASTCVFVAINISVAFPLYERDGFALSVAVAHGVSLLFVDAHANAVALGFSDAYTHCVAHDHDLGVAHAHALCDGDQCAIALSDSLALSDALGVAESLAHFHAVTRATCPSGSQGCQDAAIRQDRGRMWRQGRRHVPCGIVLRVRPGRAHDVRATGE